MTNNGYPPGKGEEPMLPHKFKVGDIVTVRPVVSRNVPDGVYEVVKQLPGSAERERERERAPKDVSRTRPR